MGVSYLYLFVYAGAGSAKINKNFLSILPIKIIYAVYTERFISFGILCQLVDHFLEKT